MTPQFHANPFAPAISFWCSLWQSQLEQSLKLWGAWAQYVPHESAAELSAEANMLKPVVRTARSSSPKTTSAKPVAAKRAAPKPAPVAAVAATPTAAPVAAAPATEPAPAKAPAKAPARAPRTTPARTTSAKAAPAKAKAGSADPAKPVVH